jgi:hypothetical protein
VCTLVCVACHGHGRATLLKHFFWDELDEGKLQYRGQSSMLSASVPRLQDEQLSHPKMPRAHFFPGDVMWRHSIERDLDSGSKWWTQASSRTSICDRKPSSPTSHEHKKISGCALIPSSCSSVSIRHHVEAQTSTIQHST